MTNLSILKSIHPQNETEERILNDLLNNCPECHYEDPSNGDAILSHIECQYNLMNVTDIDLDGEPLTPESPYYNLHYKDGINFLNKYYLMPK